MDPYAPIQGISLERYAELGAELDGITDPSEQAKKVEELGVSAADFEAAKQGFTARMQDMSLMGQVATRYMQLYNEALAKTKGTTMVSFEDWCAMSAAIQVFGVEAMMGHYGISSGDWTTISAHWTTELSRDPMNLGMRRNQLQEQEAARMRAGGQPKDVSLQRSAPGRAPAGGAAAYDPNAHSAMQMQAAAQQQAASMQLAAGVMNQGAVSAAAQMAGAMNMMGGGSHLVPGRQVMVQWSDGNRYPATLMQNSGEQAQVVVPDGRQMWLETRFLTPG
jgi:hypothetical protein